MNETMLLDPAARIRALSDVGCGVSIDNSIPTRRYFRSGMEMIRMANTYLEEGNLENAFIMYTKFITLFVEKLPKHELYKEANQVDKANNKKKLKEIFPKAEKIKKMLSARYDEQAKQYAEKARQHEQELKKQQQKQKADEEKRREQQKRVADVGSVNNERVVVPPHNLPISEPSPAIMWPDDLLNDRHPQNTVHNNQNISNDSLSSYKAANDFNSVKMQEKDHFLNVIPKIDRSLKPSSLLSPGVVESSNKSGLRDVVVPAGLLTSFKRLAQTNTTKNIETCGILAGKLVQSKFSVTHLIVPKQRGTSDSCTTENEEELFEYQDKYDLITLGWIHTHPTQTSFLSSVDLHTHCSYQLMMPEAIAIVVAPKYNETGIFSLTPSYGLDFIANCRQNGFHPHPKEPPLFEESGHAVLVDGSSATVVDLRS